MGWFRLLACCFDVSVWGRTGTLGAARGVQGLRLVVFWAILEVLV